MRLPRNLLEAIEDLTPIPSPVRCSRRSSSTAYVEMKLREWDSYHAQVSDWERRTYLEMF